MKTFIAILALVSMVLASPVEWTPKTHEEMKQIRADCLAEYPLSKDLQDKLMEFNYPNEEIVRQYLLCVSIKMGFFCPNEGYHADNFAKQLKDIMDESEVLAATQACVDEFKSATPNDVLVYRVHKCFMDSPVGGKAKIAIKNKYETAQENKTA